MDKRGFLALAMLWVIVVVLVADNGVDAGCESASTMNRRFHLRCKKNERTKSAAAWKETLRNVENARNQDYNTRDMEDFLAEFGLTDA